MPVPREQPDAGDCTSHAQCSGTTPRCNVATGQCVGCLSAKDCSIGYCDTTTMTCAHVPDSCASAAALDLSFGMAEVQGDTTYADDDTTLSCALPGSEGRDVVYVVSLATRSSFEAIAVPKPGSALKPVLQLRRVCNNADNALSLACAYATTNTSTTRLSIDSVDPGTYFLWLDSEGSEAGAYTLTVKLDPAAIGESCATPRTVLVADNPVELTGDTGPLTDDAFGTCGGQGAGDAVFRLENVAARRVRFEVSAVEGGWAPVVYLRSGACDDAARANQLGCALARIGHRGEREHRVTSADN